MTDPRMTPTNDAPVTVEREYRKTATIRAVQWWKMGDHPAVRMYDDIIADGKDTPWIDTLEGGHIVTPGDWIATGVKGEHWAIKPDVFAATYSPVEPAMDFGEAIDPNASHNRRHRLAALASAPAGDGAFQMGDRVEKVSGSSWRSKVVGTYSTALTPEGYCVESETETGSVQIYPAKALRLVRPRAAVGEREAIEKQLDHAKRELRDAIENGDRKGRWYAEGKSEAFACVLALQSPPAKV